MTKYTRQLDSNKVQQSKERTMDAVMSRINQPQQTSWLRHLWRPILVPTLVLVIALVLILQPGQDPIDQPFTVSAQESQTLAEISYLSSSLIAANITVMDDSFQFMAVNMSTAFEDNNDEINVYFDMLKVFLDDQVFSESVTVTLLEDSEYTQLMEFTLHNRTYQFYLAVEDTIITGELIVNNTTFIVTGTLEEDEDEYSVELEATNGNDYVHISYETEGNTETETNYEVQTRISGVLSNKEIKVSMEGDEAKVEIKEGDDSYELKREIEDGITQYKLEYKINNVEGEAVITESTDTTGQVTYSYQIKEGDTEKEIERGRPTYDYDDDDDEDEDDDDEPGNNDDTPGNNDNDNPGNNDEDEEDDEPGNSDEETPGSQTSGQDDEEDNPGNSDEDSGQSGTNGNENHDEEDDPEEQQSTYQHSFVKKMV